MKKFFLILLTICISISVCACLNGVNVPDLTDVEVDVAKNILSNNGLIPVVEYAYDDEITYGNVVKTEPESGAIVSKNQTVRVYVSKGPAFLRSKDSTITWYDISDKDDEWSFINPYIDSGIMYIDCTPKFGIDMSWKEYKNGYGFGEASINDTFDKTVPIKIKAEKAKTNANEEQNITLEIPLEDLTVQKPTTMYLKLIGLVDGQQENIMINFAISW